MSWHLTDHLQRSVHIGPEDFVFTQEFGGPLNPDVLRRDVLYPALDRTGISRPKRASGFHAFRHSAGSFLNEQTGNLKLAQRFLGHADISTTANIYTHTSSESDGVLRRRLSGQFLEICSQLFSKQRTRTAVATQSREGQSSQLQ